MKRAIILFLLSICLMHPVPAEDKIESRHGISYENGDRFGDRVLGYAQARYLSYVTGLQFFHRPFNYSEHLTIDYEALPYDKHSNKYSISSINSAESLADFFCKIRDPQTPPTMFVVDYFPSELGEWEIDPERSVAFDIPWHDPEFKSFLNKSLSPRIPIPDFREPGRLNVATHVRTMSGYDSPWGSLARFPLKLPTSDYHKRQIKRVYQWNLQRPMHVFLFSDSGKPAELLEEFRNSFHEYDITFSIQILEKPDLNNVVQDFFGMQQFDVLIATQSNFSMMASRLGSFDMIIYPIHAEGRYPEPSTIDRIQLVTKPSSWFPYAINTILKDN